MDKRILYTTTDIQEIFKLGKSKAYELIRSKSFPSIKIGRSYYIPKVALEKWLASNINQSIIL